MTPDELKSLRESLHSGEDLTYSESIELLDLIERQGKVIEAASEINRLLNEWELIRQHSYVHEKLNKALKELEG